MKPLSAPHNRQAFSTSVSRTGWRSNTDREITFKTSAVAVWLLERLAEIAVALLHLLEQPCVLDRDHGLVGEGHEQLNLLIGKRLHGSALQRDDAYRCPLPH